jgi:hypothetical protein
MNMCQSLSIYLIANKSYGKKVSSSSVATPAENSPPNNSCTTSSNSGGGGRKFKIHFDKCGKTFARKYNIERHLRSAHKREYKL